MYKDEFCTTTQWSLCGLPECENRFYMLHKRYQQSEVNSAYTDEIIQQNSLLKIREEQLQKQLEEENATSEEMRIKLLDYMKAHFPLEEERSKYLAQYDEIKKQYDDLHISNSALAMHNKQLSLLVDEQEQDKKLSGKRIKELQDELKLSKKETNKIMSEMKKLKTNCRLAITSIVKAAEVLKSKKLLPAECSKKLAFWKKMLKKLTKDPTNTSESSSNSDSSPDSDIEAVGNLLEKELISAEERYYLSTDQNVKSIDTKVNYYNIKTCIEIGINTDVSGITATLNVGVQTLIKGIECPIVQKSIFSPESDLTIAETQSLTFSCDSYQKFLNSGRISVLKNFSSSDDEICFEDSVELIKDQNITKLPETPPPIDGRGTKFPSLEMLAERNENLEKSCGSNMSTEEVINQFNNLKKLYALETSSNYIQVLEHLKQISSHLYRNKPQGKNLNIYPKHSNTFKRRFQECGGRMNRSNFRPITLSCKSDIPIEHQAIASKLQLVSEFSELYKISPVVTTHSSKLVSNLREVDSRPRSIVNKVNKDIESKIEKDLEIEMAKIKLEIMTQLRNKYSEILKKPSLPVIRNDQIPSTNIIKRKCESYQNTHTIKRCKILPKTSEYCERTMRNQSSSGIFTVTPCNTLSKNEMEKPLKNKSHSRVKFLNERCKYPKLIKVKNIISRKGKQKPFKHLSCTKSYKLFSKKKVDLNSRHFHQETPQTIAKKSLKSTTCRELQLTPDKTCPEKKDLNVAHQEKTANLTNVWLNIENYNYIPTPVTEMPQNGLCLKTILDEIQNMNFKSHNVDTNCVQSMSSNGSESEFTEASPEVLNVAHPEINSVVPTDTEINLSHINKKLIQNNVSNKSEICRGVNSNLIEMTDSNVNASFTNLLENISKLAILKENLEQSEQHNFTKKKDFDKVTPPVLVVSTNEGFDTNTCEDVNMVVENENLNIHEDSSFSGTQPSLDETVFTLFTEMGSSDAVSVNYNNINSSGNACANNYIDKTISKHITEVGRKAKKSDHKNGPICIHDGSQENLDENINLLEITSETNRNYEPEETNSEMMNFSSTTTLNEMNGLITTNNNKLDLQVNSSEKMNNSFVNLNEANSDKLDSVIKSLQKGAKKLSEASKVRRSLRLRTPKSADRPRITERRSLRLLNSTPKSADRPRITERRSLRLLNSTPKSADRPRITEVKKIKRASRYIEDISPLKLHNEKRQKSRENVENLGEKNGLSEISSQTYKNCEFDEKNSEMKNFSSANNNGLINTTEIINKLDIQVHSSKKMNKSFVNLNGPNSDKKLDSAIKSLQKVAKRLSEGGNVRRSLRLLNSTPKSVDRPNITVGKKIKRAGGYIEDTNRNVKSARWRIASCRNKTLLKDYLFLSSRRSPRHVNKNKETNFPGNLQPKADEILCGYDTDYSFSKVLSKFSSRRKEYKKLSSLVKNKVSCNRPYKNYKIKLNGQILELSLESNKQPIETSVCQTSSNNGKVEEIIKKYSSGKLKLKYAIEKLQNLSDVHTLSKCIFQSVYQDSLQSLKRKKSFYPHLTGTQQKFVVLISILQEEKKGLKNLADSILILIEDFIFTPNSSTLEDKRLLYIGQFYSALCRLEQSLKKAHIACYDALHCLGEKGFPFIYGILITFPEAMPISVIGNLSPRCVAIAHIILSSNGNNLTLTKKLKALLRDRYGYQATTFMFDVPDFKIVEKLRDNLPSIEIYATLLLLAKSKGFDWAVNILIKKILLPVIIAWNFGNVEEHIAEEVIDLISAVSLPYLDEHDFTEEMGILADILANSKSSLKLQMTVAESLARMVKNNFELVANALYYWTPDGKVSELFLRNLGHLLLVCPYKSWTSFKKSKVIK